MRTLLVLLLFISMLSCKPSNKIGELVGVPKERSLENTYWVLTEINGKAITNSSKPLFIQLNPDGNKISGFGGCNQLAGQYTVSGKKITFKTAATQMFCQETMEIETSFFQTLESINGFSILEHDLFLKKENNVVLILRADVKKQN